MPESFITLKCWLKQPLSTCILLDKKEKRLIGNSLTKKMCKLSLKPHKWVVINSKVLLKSIILFWACYKLSLSPQESLKNFWFLTLLKINKLVFRRLWCLKFLKLMTIISTVKIFLWQGNALLTWPFIKLMVKDYLYNSMASKVAIMEVWSEN